VPPEDIAAMRAANPLASLWHILTTWEQAMPEPGPEADAHAIARVVQKNMANYSEARQRRYARGAAAAGRRADNDGGHSDNDSNNDGDRDDEAAADAAAADNAILQQPAYVDFADGLQSISPEAVAARLEDMLDSNSLSATTTAYEQTVFAPLPVDSDGLACRTPHGTEVRVVGAAERSTHSCAIQQALQAVKSFDGTTSTPTSPPTHVDHTIDARLTAVTTGVHDINHEPGAVPYVRLAQRPTVGGTARIFGLSTDQAEPFVLLATTLEKESNKQRCSPIRMVLMGEPGSGKSQILKALQW